MQGPGALLVSLSALPSLLYSPALNANHVSLASLRQASALKLSCCLPALCEVSLARPPSILIRYKLPLMPAPSDGCLPLIASAGAYCARDMCICRRVHSPCQKSLRRASFGFEDLFGGDEGVDSSESMAADEVSAEGTPERSA